VDESGSGRVASENLQHNQIISRKFLQIMRMEMVNACNFAQLIAFSLAVS